MYRDRLLTDSSAWWKTKNYSFSRVVYFFFCELRFCNLRQKHIKTGVNYVTSGVCGAFFFVVNDRASDQRIRVVRGVNNDVRDGETIYLYNNIIYVYIFITTLWQ